MSEASARLLRAAAVPRAELFLTGKLATPHHRPDDARQAFQETLSDLGVEYLDLYLIHWPLPTLYDGDFVSTWKTLEEFKEEGGRGLSGCPTSRSTICAGLPAKPNGAGRQPDRDAPVSPSTRRFGVYGAEHGIATEAWSPLGRGAVLGDSTIGATVQKYGKTVAQVILRWHIQLGNIVVPKVGNSVADARELRGLRLRARARGHGRDQRARPE